MIVVVATVQFPIVAHVMPATTIPSPQGAFAVQVAANAPPLVASSTPTPLRTLVVVVATVQFPDATHSAPAALVITVQVPTTVAMHTDASVVVCPAPLTAAMMAVVVGIAAIQMPI